MGGGERRRRMGELELKSKQVNGGYYMQRIRALLQCTCKRAPVWKRSSKPYVLGSSLVVQGPAVLTFSQRGVK